MRILGLIPARSGSKGIPRKNIRIFNEKPLISHTIETALSSKFIDRVIVSTDSNEIAQVSKDAGAEVPFLRPVELANDDTPMKDVIIHCMNEMRSRDWIPDILVLLQPTSPFRTLEHLDAAIDKYLKSAVTCLVSVRKVTDNPYWMKITKERHLVPFITDTDAYSSRQSLPEVYILNGAIYIWKTSYLLDSTQQLPDDTIPYEMDEYASIDLDDELGWRFAEFLLKENIKKVIND